MCDDPVWFTNLIKTAAADSTLKCNRCRTASGSERMPRSTMTTRSRLFYLECLHPLATARASALGARLVRSAVQFPNHWQNLFLHNLWSQLPGFFVTNDPVFIDQISFRRACNSVVDGHPTIEIRHCKDVGVA